MERERLIRPSINIRPREKLLSEGRKHGLKKRDFRRINVTEEKRWILNRSVRIDKQETKKWPEMLRIELMIKTKFCLPT